MFLCCSAREGYWRYSRWTNSYSREESANARTYYRKRRKVTLYGIGYSLPLCSIILTWILYKLYNIIIKLNISRNKVTIPELLIEEHRTDLNSFGQQIFAADLLIQEKYKKGSNVIKEEIQKNWLIESLIRQSTWNMHNQGFEIPNTIAYHTPEISSTKLIK